MQHHYSTTLGLFGIIQQHYCLSFSLKTKVVPLQEHWNRFAKPFDGDCVRKLIDLKEGTTKILDKQFFEGVVYEDTIWDDPKDEEDWKKRHPEGPVKL